MDKKKAIYQIVWGALLTLMGIALIFRIPQVMEQIVQIEYYAPIKWFIRAILYIIVLMLLGGGLKKIYDNYTILTDPNQRSASSHQRK